MKFPVKSVGELGLLVRAARRHSELRLDDLAGTARLSKQFVQDVEHGKETVRMGLVFKLLDELGVTLTVDIPDGANDEVRALLAKRLMGGGEIQGASRSSSWWRAGR